MTTFELLVGFATIGSFAIAFLSFRASKTPKAEPIDAEGRTTVGSDVPPQDVGELDFASESPVTPIPVGVTLGDKVVIVPGFQQRLFTHAGRPDEEIWWGKEYSWIKRGQVIGRYHMTIPNSNEDYFRHFMGKKEKSVDVRSPVSGLILHSHFNDFIHWPEQENAPEELPIAAFAILVPDDEPKPDSAEHMFGDLIRFMMDNKGPLFRHSPYWSLEPMDDELFEQLIEMQKNATCLVTNAMPRYQDYLEEARTKYPYLRPYLKHLL
ncbi:hypothetical protein [uncultured Roseobacter sp.]|uniref:hypothetical protein n=1 Tax=uncultured Roseobacter sp. TaxID=114847 RepID=UPI0026110251|nr:hypothetical protein [uncultured Roseobacter sp.]